MENRNNTVSYFKSLKTRLDDANERYKRVTNNLGDNWKQVEASVFDDIALVLDTSANLHLGDPDQWRLVTECFRCLRNSCVSCKRNQELVGRSTKIFSATTVILKSCHEHIRDFDAAHIRSESEIQVTKAVVIALRCGMQFLGNAVVGFPNNQLVMWDNIVASLNCLLSCLDEPARRYTCMLIYNCLHSDQVDKLAGGSGGGTAMTLDVIRHLTISDDEWGEYIIQRLFAHPAFMKNIFEKLPGPHRVLVLDIACEHLGKQTDDGEADDVSAECVQYISSHFVENAGSILLLGQQADTDQRDAVVVTKYLEILCAASTLPKMYPALHSDTELLKTATKVLHCIETIGNDGDNAFTAISKLAAGDGDPNHPAHRLRSNLIRLIGNMCFQNRSNQDQVRELDGIPLIMNHTSIDSKNPYITQWSIFAIRNICNGNKENQAVISGMHQEGLANNVSLLQEFGVTAELSDGKIVVRNTDEKQPSPFTK